MGDFKVGVSVGVYYTKCTLNTGVNTNFEITQCMIRTQSRHSHDDPKFETGRQRTNVTHHQRDTSLQWKLNYIPLPNLLD
jgi:hypothetical protein